MTQRPLTGSEIRDQLFGQLMSGEYPSGEQWAERFNRDGTSDYSHGGRITRGQMSLNGNILCFVYPVEDETGGCFEVWKRGKNCFDFYVASASTPLSDRQFGQNWDARGWYSDVPRTCVSEQIS